MGLISRVSSRTYRCPKKIQGALRTHGCWSEHKSSSGRIYYYNYESKQNQWQKPDSWRDSEAVVAPQVKKVTKKPEIKQSSSSSSSSKNNPLLLQQQKRPYHD